MKDIRAVIEQNDVSARFHQRGIRIDYPSKKVKELQEVIDLSIGNNLSLVEYFKSMELAI